MKNPTIDDFPAHIQARIRAAWAVEDAKKAAHGGQDGPGRACGGKGGSAPVQMEKPPSQGKIKRYTKSQRGPNKTEQAYNLRFLAGEGRYEAITLRLPGGSRYTPDWMSICPLGFVHLHEVKGAYRHPSQGRALTAWREARAAFPCFRFHWAKRLKSGEWEFKHDTDERIEMLESKCSTLKQRAWRAESRADEKWGLRKELAEALGVSDKCDDEALRAGLAAIRRLENERDDALARLDQYEDRNPVYPADLGRRTSNAKAEGL